MEIKSFVDLSKMNWGVESHLSPSDSQLQLGTFQRIAAACELMARNHTDLVAERDRYKTLYEQQRFLRDEEVKRRHHQERCNNSLRGVITRLKKKVNA
jgi:hypothetical protein